MKLVVGATGLVGSEICRLLVEKGKSVRALVRKSSDPEKVATLEKLGVELAIGDLREPSSLLGLAKRAVEEALRSSGLKYTILQPSCFAETWLSPSLCFDAVNGSARIYGDGKSEISWISYHDVAKFAVESIGNPAAENAVIELGDPEPLNPLNVVKIFEKASGKRFEVQHIPVEALREQFAAAADPLQKSFAGLMLFYAGGHIVDMKATAADFGFELKSVKDLAFSA